MYSAVLIGGAVFGAFLPGLGNTTLALAETRLLTVIDAGGPGLRRYEPTGQFPRP